MGKSHLKCIDLVEVHLIKSWILIKDNNIGTDSVVKFKARYAYSRNQCRISFKWSALHVNVVPESVAEPEILLSGGKTY